MAARTALVHPDLLASLPQWYPQIGTIQERVGTQDQYGQPTETWQDVTGLIDLPCRIAPVSVSEARTPEQTIGTITHRIALQGYYPAIRETLRFVSAEQAYDIQGVQSDAQTRSTYLDTEIVR